MKREQAEGFLPVFDAHSRLLILGSFPSVKSREVSFYYGNPQNRFWKTVCGFFGEEVPGSIEGKREFLLRRNIALWDVVMRCTVTGSADASIGDVTPADIPSLLRSAPVEAIFCNGGKAFSLLEEYFPACMGIARKLPSTSPANPRFSPDVWESALSSLFGSFTKIPGGY